MKTKNKTGYDLFKSIRKPIAPYTKVFKDKPEDKFDMKKELQKIEDEND
jgi:histidyl-tRNA synthetase